MCADGLNHEIWPRFFVLLQIIEKGKDRALVTEVTDVVGIQDKSMLC